MLSNRNQLHLARRLRADATDAEQILWEALRGRRFYGLKFKRQQLLGRFVVDFVCFQKRLIIEIDGGIHNEPDIQVVDSERAEWLKTQHFTVVRFKNDVVLGNIDALLKNLEARLGLR